MDWMARIGDLGWMPEAALRASLTDNGQVPITEPPRIRLDNGRLHAEVDGDASIGFSEGEGSWQLYTGPVRVTLPVRVKAVRYGFRESPVVSISPTSGTGSGTQAR